MTVETLSVLSVFPSAVTLAVPKKLGQPRLSWSGRFSPSPRDTRREKSAHQGPPQPSQMGQQLSGEGEQMNSHVLHSARGLRFNHSLNMFLELL